MSPRKYKHDDITADYNLLLDDVLASTSQADTVNKIRRFQRSHDDYTRRTIEPTEFKLDDAISAFGLNYDTTYSASERRGWAIDEVPETKGFHPSHCLTLLLENYSKNFDRSSEAVCRTAIDFTLNECLTSMKANPASHGQTTREHSTAPPHPLRNIKAFGKVSFSHTITSMDLSPSQSSYSGVKVNGRVDHGIGRAIASHNGPNKQQFQSLLLLVEAKVQGSIETAFTQLVVYLGALHQSRVLRKRSDASVYGVTSDGYLFVFVTITHEGELKRSRQFDIVRRLGDLAAVLGCLRFLLEKSASTTPNRTPEKDTDSFLHVDDDADPALDPYDNPFVRPCPNVD